ncbi:MdtA/MuxA family multidrug efflux RND transporter periplasmic adaptor subunit [Undibacterium jejuense]|nr:MdtA/MuxA family multidrug efflux RND transporter periplasmic adaptor subunit [Undibacterium jejuense]
MSDSNNKFSRGMRYAVTAVVIAGVVSGIWWITHKQPAAAGGWQGKGGMPVAVGIAAVVKQDAPLQMAALGTVNSTYTVTVRSRVDGQLEKVHFVEGQLVKQGQLLAELDARPYQAALMQAEGQLLRDQALLKNAQLDLQRYRQLLAQNSIAKQQVDTQEALEQQYQGTVKNDQGIVENAKLQLSYSRITAPVTGRVGLRQVDPGNIVHSSDANGVVVITQIDPINVLFSVPETSLSNVLAASQEANGQLKVEVWDRDNKHKIAEGMLLAIDNQLNTATGTVNLKAKFSNEKQSLFPNQFVNVHLQLGARTNVLTVPTPAIQLGKVGSYVYIVNEDSTVSISKVVSGPVSGDNTIIESGLQAGQKVVTDGLDKLREGAKVKLVDRNAKPDAGGDDASRGHGKNRKGGANATGSSSASASVPAASHAVSQSTSAPVTN